MVHRRRRIPIALTALAVAAAVSTACAIRCSERGDLGRVTKTSGGNFGGRKQVYIALLERIGTRLEEQLPPPVGRSARARLADSVSRWLDWTEQNRTIWLATLGRGEDIADPDIRNVVTELVRRAVALLASQHAEIADDSPRLRYALECWTGLNRAATRRWLQGEASTN